MHSSFKAQKWLTSNFSQYYQYIIHQTGDVNIQTYQTKVILTNSS